MENSDRFMILQYGGFVPEQETSGMQWGSALGSEPFIATFI